MEKLLEKVIKKAYELQFIDGKVKILLSDCFVPGEEDELFKFADYLRYKKIPSNNVISFKTIFARQYIYELTLNILKKKELQDFYENKISLIDLLNENHLGGIMQFNNTFNSYDNSTQNININYNLKNDWNALEKVLNDLNVTSEQIDELKNAIQDDKSKANQIENDSVLFKTKEVAKKIVTFVGGTAANTSIVLTVQTLAKALSSYFGFPVQF